MNKELSIEIITALYNKINEIKSKQIFLKEFENQIENNLVNMFPNIVQSLKKTNGNMEEWLVEIINCENVEMVKNVLDKMNEIENELISASKTENIDNTEFSKQLESLKTNFDSIVLHMKLLGDEIIKLEKNIIQKTN